MRPHPANPGPDPGDRAQTFARAAFWCGLGVTGLGLLGILDGLTGLFNMSLAFPGGKPMAVSSGIVLALAGAAVALAPRLSRFRFLILAAAGLAGLEGLVNVLQGLTDREDLLYFLDLDSLGRAWESRMGLSHSLMSPFTGAGLAALGLGLALLALSRGRRVRGAAGLTGTAVFAGGFIFFLSYIYGSPLLYGSGVIPVSLSTTLSLMLAGIGLAFAAGPDALPFRPLLGPSIYARLVRTFPPLMAGLFLLHPFVERIFHIDHAGGESVLADATFAVLFAGFTMILVLSVGRTMGKSLDRAEAARHAAEMELDKSRKLIRAILDAIPQAVVGVSQAGEVTHFNLAAQALAGLDYQQAKGLPLRQVFPLLTPRMEALTATLNERRVQHLERTCLAGGQDRLWDVDLYPLEANGSSGAVIRLDDVTDRVRLEEIMIQSEKMMSVGQVAAGMAHEINNPLGGIAQSAQVLLRRLSQDSPANLKAAEEAGCTLAGLRQFLLKRDIMTLLEAMRQGAVRAARIVADMLEFSRRSDSTPANVDLPALMDKAVELCKNDYDLKKKFDFRRIEIRREYQPDMPRVPCSGNQMEQVFVNLLRNAAQAMAENNGDGPGPMITLRARVEQDMARLEVADNGPGMSPEIRRRAFEPFFTTKPQGLGTGLGLSVSYFIVVSNHRGALEVQSMPGAGARFIISLPLGKAPAEC